MNPLSPKFPVRRPSFQLELKKRVDAYFKENHKNPTGNFKLYMKAAFVSTAFLGIYIFLVFFTPDVFIALAACALLGVSLATIGFNVMHDGAHGSFSRFQLVNRLAAKSLDFLGGSSFMWKYKHNMIHHTYTNIDGLDEDIDVKPFLRISPTQKRYWFHRFQHVYCFLLYGTVHIFWILIMDFKKYFSQKVGPFPIKEMKFKDHVSFWLSKLSFAIVFVAVPIYFTGILPFLLGFTVFSASAGVTLGTVFQLAHAVEPLDFPLPDTNNLMEDEWAAIQVKTTANFATSNPIVTYLTGGLNFQIEHHLFPKISHVHYPALSKIVKDTCAEFQLHYNEFPRMRQALWSHLMLLRQLGIR